MASSLCKWNPHSYRVSLHLVVLFQRLFSHLPKSSSSATHRLNTVVPKGFEKYFPGGSGKAPQTKDTGTSFLPLFSFNHVNVRLAFLAGNQRPPATPKEPVPGETPSQANATKPPTPTPTPGRGPASSSSGGGGGGMPWRGLEFKFTPGDKNSFFNNRTALAVLLGGAVAGYLSYNNGLYRETTWKDFVSQYLLRGYVS